MGAPRVDGARSLGSRCGRPHQGVPTSPGRRGGWGARPPKESPREPGCALRTRAWPGGRKGREAGSFDVAAASKRPTLPRGSASARLCARAAACLKWASRQAPPGLGPRAPEAVGVPPGPALRSPCAAPGGADFEAAREAVLDSARERRRGGGYSGRPETSSWARPQVQAEGLTGAAARVADGTGRAAGLRRTGLCDLSPFTHQVSAY